QHDALFRPHALGPEEVAGAIHAGGKVGVGVAALVVDEGRLAAAAFRDMAVDEMSAGVIPPRQIEKARHHSSRFIFFARRAGLAAAAAGGQAAWASGSTCSTQSSAQATPSSSGRLPPDALCCMRSPTRL